MLGVYIENLYSEINSQNDIPDRFMRVYAPILRDSITGFQRNDKDRLVTESNAKLEYIIVI